jgi:hypothetical protein
VTHRNERLIEGSQVRIGGESLPPSFDPPDNGVLDGDYAGLGLAVMNSSHSPREGRNRYVFDRMPPDLRYRALGICPAIALIRYAHLGLGRLRVSIYIRPDTISA